MARIMNSTSDGIIASSYSSAAFSLPFTISCWFISGGGGASYATIIENEFHSGTEYAVFMGRSASTSKLAYYVRSGASTTVFVDPGTHTFTSGTWTHAAVVVTSGGGVTAYFNGASDGTVSGAAGGTAVANDFRVGNATNGGSNANGWTFADAAWWNIDLTTTEISALANGARPYRVRKGSLQLWWPLDGLQSPEPDMSGNAYNGTLTGTALASGPPLMPFTSRWPMVAPVTLPPAAPITLNTPFSSTFGGFGSMINDIHPIGY